MSSLCTYCDLPGVSGSQLEGPMVGSPSGAVRAIANHRACSAAGDHGAIMVWTDDRGVYRSAFMRYMSTVASGEFTSKARMLVWLKSWWPAMRDTEHRGAA